MTGARILPLLWAAVAALPLCAQDAGADLDAAALEYVNLALELGTHDDGYIDAYIGPPEIRRRAEAAPRDLATIEQELGRLIARLQDDAPLAGRARYLHSQLLAVQTRARMLQGTKYSFDEESRLLYGSVSPRHDEAWFAAIIERVAALVPPGRGTLLQRLQRFTQDFARPGERLDEAMQRTLRECRKRTAAHLSLPEGERFTLEYVTGKVWSGYNWYKGDYVSLLQINTDTGPPAGRLVDLGCHEGYPGHHLYNLMMEQRLVRERGWLEFSVQPLYTPQALFMEGTANYGIEMAFPGREQLRFERDVLFPILGLDQSRAELYWQLRQARRDLSYARTHAAREYQDGRWTREQAIEWLMQYGLQSRRAAEGGMAFYDKYGAYIINYNHGRDLVRRHVESGGPQHRWERYKGLLGSTRIPADLEPGP